MNADSIWNLFYQTGHVSCYLMYRELSKQEQRVENIMPERAGEQENNKGRLS